MLVLDSAKQLMALLSQHLGKPPVGVYPEPNRAIPRPALVADDWRFFNLQGHTEPKNCKYMDPENLHEFFNGFVVDYLHDKYVPEDHAFAYINSGLELRERDAAMLLPTRKGRPVHTKEDAMYGLGIILWCAQAMGYQLLYGKDWAIVLVDEHTSIGVDQGKVVCNVEKNVIDVPAQDWVEFFESPREGGGNEPIEIFQLYKRARSHANKDWKALSQAVSILTWSNRRLHRMLVSTHYFKGATLPLVEYITQSAMQSDNPVGTLRKLLVPEFTTASHFRDLTSEDLYYQGLWESKEVEEFIENTLRKLAIPGTQNNNNKKGKSHVDRNHRQGRSG